MDKNTGDFCNQMKFLLEHFYKLQSEAMKIADLLDLFLLQIENKKANTHL